MSEGREGEKGKERIFIKVLHHARNQQVLFTYINRAVLSKSVHAASIAHFTDVEMASAK